MRPVVEALMSLRCIELIAAMTLGGDRGLHPLCTAERADGVPGVGALGVHKWPHTPTGAHHQTGNSHARRVLIEAAWNYRSPARMSETLQRRQGGQPKAVREIAWRAQLRLPRRYRHLSARKLALNKICVAIARELAAFVWDIARQVKPLA